MAEETHIKIILSPILEPVASPGELREEAVSLKSEITEKSLGKVKTQQAADFAFADTELIVYLLVFIAPTVVGQLMMFVAQWSLRREGRSLKIRVEDGDRSIEVKYNPHLMSKAELKEAVDAITSFLTDNDDSGNSSLE